MLESSYVRHSTYLDIIFNTAECILFSTHTPGVYYHSLEQILLKIVAMSIIVNIESQFMFYFESEYQ
jgi:hypothetical protein